MITIYHSGGLTKNDRLTDNSEIGFLVGQLIGPLHTHYTCIVCISVMYNYMTLMSHHIHIIQHIYNYYIH